MTPLSPSRWRWIASMASLSSAQTVCAVIPSRWATCYSARLACSTLSSRADSSNTRKPYDEAVVVHASPTTRLVVLCGVVACVVVVAVVVLQC
jgi:hypothetical protein